MKAVEFMANKGGMNWMVWIDFWRLNGGAPDIIYDASADELKAVLMPEYLDCSRCVKKMT
jgi:hypothetical protein